MKIVIATGIYPPDIGGPAQFAKGTEGVWWREGHEVSAHHFRALRWLPTGVRHLVFFARLIPSVFRANFIFIPDTFSAAVPAVFAGKLFRVPTIIRTGGDFLWEWYVERTGDLVLLRDFYQTRMGKLNSKEKLVFRLAGWAFRNASAVVFSTAWQRDLFLAPYRLAPARCYIVENYYGERLGALPPARKVFLMGARLLKWKNAERVKKAFEKVRAAGVEVGYDDEIITPDNFLEKIRRSYAVIIATLGDVSPNTILDAIRCEKPFILTRETGFRERLKDIALFVDPESLDDIAEKIIWLSDEKNYAAQQAKIRAFLFRHSWEEICREIVAIKKNL
ncbi:MAG: hypothetical protein G01um101472_617 [Parcubacteria group bacterium Gr01-1014_72]|nr:MAG: hypothetical protein G01um101472_617 [Parcubacteria group bacterium Gr01-1014_72]